MINKQSLWFLTLFSLILVLSIYYITMPNELLLTNNNVNLDENKEESDLNPVIDIYESDMLIVFKSEKEEEYEEKQSKLKSKLTDSEASVDDKNKAFEQLKELNNSKGLEDSIENSIKEKFNLNSVVKIADNHVTVVAAKDEHDEKLANDIMRLVQSNFESKMYISVRFQK